MHGLTGGSWKRSYDQTTATEKNDPTGNREATAAPGPTVDQCHRASSRPSDWDSGSLASTISLESRSTSLRVPGHDHCFNGMLLSPVVLSDPSKPLDSGMIPPNSSQLS